MNIRYLVYLAIAAAYILFGLIGGWGGGLWPWGAVILGVPMIIAEVGTYWSIKRRNK